MYNPKTSAVEEAAPAKPIITSLDQAHQWTHTGDEVLILRCINKDGTSYNGFVNPMKVGESIKPDTWDPDPVCGDGIHGWAWGLGLGDGKDPQWDGIWQVAGCLPKDVVGNIEGDRKCKFSKGILRFVGGWDEAMRFILPGQMELVSHIASQSNKAHATGDRSASSATGNRSASSATGYRSASSATGESSASVVTGLDGKARAGKYGCIALGWWNPHQNRGEMQCRQTGCGDGSDGKLKADTWYQLDESGNFVESNND